MTDPELVRYYKERAKEYDNLYTRPDRQEHLAEATSILQKIFAGKEVFEIACGTGYWTEQLAKTAKSVLATDINETMLEVARSRTYSPAPVQFAIRDLYELSSEKHESLFAGFFWSHVLLQDRDSFIDTINTKVKPGGKVVFIDNLYVEGSNLPIAETDSAGNTYQLRSLEDGTKHKVLKNFPDEQSLCRILVNKTTDIKFTRLKYYWILEYTTL